MYVRIEYVSKITRLCINGTEKAELRDNAFSPEFEFLKTANFFICLDTIQRELAGFTQMQTLNLR